MQYSKHLSVDSMDFQWTPLQRLNKVDTRNLACCRCRFFGGCPRDSNRTSVSTLFRSLRILSVAFHRFGWHCPTWNRKPLFHVVSSGINVHSCHVKIPLTVINTHTHKVVWIWHLLWKIDILPYLFKLWKYCIWKTYHSHIKHPFKNNHWDSGG